MHAPILPTDRQTSIETVCVDLDVELIAADLFWEALLRLVIRSPWLGPSLPGWALRGKAHFKKQVATRVAIDAGNLPYRDEVLCTWTRLESAATRWCL